MIAHSGRAGMRNTRLKLILGTCPRGKAEESGIQPQGSFCDLTLTPPSRSQAVPRGRSCPPRLTLLANGSSASAPRPKAWAAKHVAPVQLCTDINRLAAQLSSFSFQLSLSCCCYAFSAVRYLIVYALQLRRTDAAVMAVAYVPCRRA
jgi:hypothetical protein